MTWVLANNKFKKNQGFTLIEMLVVIAIVAILAAIAAPSIEYSLMRQSNRANAQALVAAIKDAKVESHLRRQDIEVINNADKIVVQVKAIGNKSASVIKTYDIRQRSPIESTPSTVEFRSNKLVNFSGTNPHEYTVYCDSSKTMTGRKVILDINGNVSIESGASRC